MGDGRRRRGERVISERFATLLSTAVLGGVLTLALVLGGHQVATDVAAPETPPVQEAQEPADGTVTDHGGVASRDDEAPGGQDPVSGGVASRGADSSAAPPVARGESASTGTVAGGGSRVAVTSDADGGATQRYPARRVAAVLPPDHPEPPRADSPAGGDSRSATAEEPAPTVAVATVEPTPIAFPQPTTTDPAPAPPSTTADEPAPTPVPASPSPAPSEPPPTSAPAPSDTLSTPPDDGGTATGDGTGGATGADGLPAAPVEEETADGGSSSPTTPPTPTTPTTPVTDASVTAPAGAESYADDLPITPRRRSSDERREPMADVRSAAPSGPPSSDGRRQPEPTGG